MALKRWLLCFFLAVFAVIAVASAPVGNGQEVDPSRTTANRPQSPRAKEKTLSLWTARFDARPQAKSAFHSRHSSRRAVSFSAQSPTDDEDDDGDDLTDDNADDSVLATADLFFSGARRYVATLADDYLVLQSALIARRLIRPP